MKAFLVFVMALVTVAHCDRVHVVDINPKPNGVNVVNYPSGGGVNVVEQPGDQVIIANPDPYFAQGGQGQISISNPDPFFAQGGQGQFTIDNPDPFFAQGGQNMAGRPPYPYKQYNNPLLRGGN